MNKRALKKALKQSIPILCSYVFISMAYGMLMAENGYPWYVALLASVLPQAIRFGPSQRPMRIIFRT